MNPLEKFKQECREIAAGYENLLETPKQHADLALPCFSLAKEMKKSPIEIASELEKEFQNKLRKDSLIKEIKAAGPYINFYINSEVFGKEVLTQILKEKKKYGSGKDKQKIMVEYSSPNSNKPLHIGHLRNQSIGLSITNILKFSGNKVIIANLVNDRGAHICKSMLAYQKWGQKSTPKKMKLKGDHLLGNYYVMFEKNKSEELEKEIQQMLIRWEDKDKTTRKLWKLMNSWWLSGVKKTYKTFGDNFDVWFFESKLYDKAKPMIEEGLRKNVFFKNEKGAILANLENHGMPNKTFLREDGTSIYSTNDLILTKMKFDKYKLDRSIWVVASEQELYFKQLFKTFELLDYKWSHNCHHMSYGLVNLPSGRMKSREGTVVDADDLIEELKNLAKIELQKREKLSKKSMEKLSTDIAVGAIRYYLIKIDPRNDMMFNPEESISLEGNTGPYLQYSYARANTLLKKSKKKPKIGIFKEPIEISLTKKVSEFPSTVSKSSKELKPSLLANYTFELATLFNEYYQNIRIIDSENQEAKLALVTAVKQVLENCLSLLGIKPLEKM